MNWPFVLQVGPSSVALRGRVDPDGWRLNVAHHRFTCPMHRPQLSLEVEYRPTAGPRGQLTFQVGELASFYRDGTSVIIRLGEETSPSRADRVVALDASGQTGTLVMDVDHSTKPAASYPLQYPLEDLLFRSLLADRGALIVHACGVVWQGKGYLFIGSSGVGKSTTARLWKAAGASVLNDDRIVLESSSAGTFIHSTPWSGEYPEVSGEAAPLAAVYLLKKGHQVIYESVRPPVAGALLFAKSFPPLWDPQRIGRVLETLDRVCQAVCVGWLEVPPDQRAVEWVQRQG
ncbi:MAG TPA: hypothetical protein VN203_28795 [Candidatus Acidoferrum sp.]|nr:hypothetical protein [Candidatus Acidoferrum sp.]